MDVRVCVYECTTSDQTSAFSNGMTRKQTLRYGRRRNETTALKSWVSKFQGGYFRNLKMAKWGYKRSETQTNAMIRKQTQNICHKSKRKSCVSSRLWHTKSLQKSFFFSLEHNITLNFNAFNSCIDVNGQRLQAVSMAESLQNPSIMPYLAHIPDLLGTRVPKAVTCWRMIDT